MLGEEAQSGLKVLTCARGIVHAVRYLTQIELDIGVDGIEFARALKGAMCRIVLTQVEQRYPQPHKYGSGGTRYGRRALQCALGLGEISEHQVRKA
ncbi:MAG TPA: hypothetical protein VNM70_20305 [Burkholderiales bacterium]|jgi:hypothetical protein|nr:hypothetical protein [Burkholderiales bacterium]